MGVFETLTPAEQARQLGNPDGAVGLAVAEWLNEVNRQSTIRMLDLLEPQPGGAVLEIGFGNGRSVPDLIGRAADLRYAGIDISQTMVEEAARFNAALVAAGRASFHLAAADRMPFADAGFDRVLSIGVAHFWTDPVAALREVRRVLRPGGVCLMGCLHHREAPGFARPEYGFFLRDTAAWEAAFKAAGFPAAEVATIETDHTASDGTKSKRYAFLLTARR